MIVEPKIKGFICITAHPDGCAANVKDSVEYIKKQGKIKIPNIKNVLVVGASTGYGLESALVASYGLDANVLNVSYEKNAVRGRCATAGMYNSAAAKELADKNNKYYKIIMGDAFSNPVKEKALQIIKDKMNKIDLLIYSIAAPSRIDPVTGEKYNSVLKPIGKIYKSKGIDLNSYTLTETTVNPTSSEEEINSTIKVMGGEDLLLWVDKLSKNNLLSDNAKIICYSYIGPDLTHDIYKNGTVGMAKNHLKQTSDYISKTYNVESFVSINKALVTQSSSAIPVLPLYISLLFKLMKEKGTHENCVMQIYRLFKKLENGENLTDSDGFIRIDDFEMDESVQREVAERWEKVNDENLYDLADIDGYRNDFIKLFGFGREDIDYNNDVSLEVDVEKLDILNMIN